MRSRRRLFRAALLLTLPNVVLVTAGFCLAAGFSAGNETSFNWWRLAALWLAAIAVGVGWTIIFARRWALPLERVGQSLLSYSSAARVPVPPAASSPVRRLTHRLNRTLREAEQTIAELRARGATLQTIINAMPDPMVLTDANENVAVLNEPAARLLNIESARAAGQPIVNVINDEAILKLLEQLSPQAPLQSGEVRLRREGKRVFFRALAVRAATGELLVELQDVTALATAMQMKTDFVANASHELRTPLSAIKTAFETLREVQADDPVQAERCAVIVGGHIRRLEEMLRDLLDLSRVENSDIPAAREPVRVAELFSSLRELFATTAEQKGVSLRFEFNDSAADCTMISDRRLLHLILKNLVENSLKFTPAGGSVALRSASHDGWIDLSVADTGIGIAPQHQQRIFERFYQVDPARSGVTGRGTGLGLAIVKHAVHSLSGKLELRSEVGRGTTISCRFPIDHGAAAQAK